MQVEVVHKHVHLFEDRAVRTILASISTLAEAFQALSQKQPNEERIMTLLDDILKKANDTLQAVQAESDVDKSIMKLVEDQNAMIDKINGQLQDAISSNDPEKLNAVAQALDQANQLATANAQRVADAVKAGTKIDDSGSTGGQSGGSSSGGDQGSSGSTGGSQSSGNQGSTSGSSSSGGQDSSQGGQTGGTGSSSQTDSANQGTTGAATGVGTGNPSGGLQGNSEFGAGAASNPSSGT